MDTLEKLRVNFKSGLMSVVGGGFGGLLARWSVEGNHIAVLVLGVLLTLGMIGAGMWIDQQAENARELEDEQKDSRTTPVNRPRIKK